MSVGGMLATALAGGANVIGKQAGDDIEAGRKTDLMREQAAIEEQMRMRLAERQEEIRQRGAMADVSGPLGDAKLAYKGKELEQAGAADVARARNMIPVSTEAARAMIPVTQEAAKASSDTEREVVKAKAGDKGYTAAINTLKLADPEVRGHLAQMAAAAGASAASVRESAERLKQLWQVGIAAQAVRDEQAKLAKASSAEERKAIERKITDMGFNGKDIKSFLSTAEKAMTNGDSAMKILMDPHADADAKEIARTQLARANDFAEQAAGMAGIKARPAEVAAPPQAAIDALVKDPKLRAQFESKYPGVKADSYLKPTAAASATPGAPPRAGMLSAVSSDPLGSEKGYIKQQLLGMFDGTNKLREIATTNSNPKLRQAAQELLAQQPGYTAEDSGAPL